MRASANLKLCQHCGNEAALVVGNKVYPHRPDLYHKFFYLCQCGAYVGTHPGSREPLGRPSNAELRAAKSAAHAAFDPIWESGIMRRRSAYRWLGEQLGIPWKEVHIGWLDLVTCQRVVRICTEFTNPAIANAEAQPGTANENPESHKSTPEAK